MKHKKSFKIRRSLSYKNSQKDRRLCNKVNGHMNKVNGYMNKGRSNNYSLESFKRINIPRKKLISLLPALTMMIIIFVFSSKTAVESNGSSTFIASFVLQTKEQLFGASEPGKREVLLELINFIVRKAAHMNMRCLLSS